MTRMTDDIVATIAILDKWIAHPLFEEERQAAKATAANKKRGQRYDTPTSQEQRS